MDDAVEQLDNLARSIGACVRCDELVANRLRAVPGGGHPHCTVMVVTLHPDPADEAGDGLAGEALVADLAEFMPALACLLYTSDAADDLLCVDLGGRRIIKKKNKLKTKHT